VLAKCTDKTPEEQADADLFWPTVEGNLALDNPNQRKLDLQPVSTPSRELNVWAACAYKHADHHGKREQPEVESVRCGRWPRTSRTGTQ
jgi:hypothetical protein